MKKLSIVAALLTAFATQVSAQKTVNLLFTSDVHYGLAKEKFRGDTGVSAVKVNQAAIEQMNNLVKHRLPNDGGVGAGQVVGSIPYMAETGDIANRQEPPIQRAGVSWQQFTEGYATQLKTNHGNQTQLLLLPGNHDVSNAIGHPKKLVPALDPTSAVGIYNLMMKPKTPLINSTFNYAKDKVHYSRDIAGVHMIFVNIWPDSTERIWMEKDLKKVGAKIPVLIFAHDPPDADPKHFSNPVNHGQFTADNKFENLLTEGYKESKEPKKGEDATNMEQRGFVKFLKRHPNIKAYFHGHNNWTEYYTYHGPDNDMVLPTFRVDSPMKGKYSATEETKLSFELISIDPAKKLLTVRECLWNTKPGDTQQPIEFGQTKTIDL